MGLFSKKPGGTFFGNLLRIGANKLTGGVLGNGANMIPLPSGPQTVTTPVAPDLQNSALAETLNGIIKGATKDVSVKGGVDKDTMLMVGGIAGVAIVIALIMKK